MITFTTKRFNDLSNTELYCMLKLRAEVFVVEQNCAFLDIDDKDQISFHVLGYHNEKLVAYTRLVPTDISDDDVPSIGRVVMHPSVRNLGYGKLLMHYSISEIQTRFDTKEIVIGAQCYLDKFYRNLGFVSEGKMYLEDNIPHITMRYNQK